ncbi:MAG: nucleoside recognition domain-containing protein [Planctomycetota bacterium]
MTAFFSDLVSAISVLCIPAIIVGLPVYGLFKKVPVYECFVEGAKEGFGIAVMIIPYLVAILVAIAMFRASGAMDLMIEVLDPAFSLLGIDPNLLPMMIARPLTGSGSLGILADIEGQFGAQSLVTKTAAVMFGSTETTFYVIAVYFGAVGIKRTRHAVLAGLIADIAALFLAVYVCAAMLG